MKSEAPAPDVVVGTGTGSSAAVASVSDLAVPALDPDADALAAALAYAAAGWYVLPVQRGSKKPGSVVGERWQDRSSRDPQQIVAWFAGTDHGIALHCGRSGAVVFDVDKPEQVPDALRRYLDAAPCQSSRPNTRAALTTCFGNRRAGPSATAPVVWAAAGVRCAGSMV